MASSRSIRAAEPVCTFPTASAADGASVALASASTAAAVEASTGTDRTARFTLGDVTTRIEDFARAILDVDVDPPRQDGETRDAARMRVQCEALGLESGMLRAPLPYDCASCTVAGSGVTTAVSMPQLLFTLGDDAARFTRQLLGSMGGAQAPKVMIGSAVSGVGKTHLAYAAGQSSFLTIIIRVVSMDMANTLSLPMQWLRGQLAAIGAADDAALSRSHAVSYAMRLVILAHVHVLNIALAKARILRPAGLDKASARELSLRMFRNCTADQLVAATIAKLEGCLRTTAAAPTLDREHMLAYQAFVAEGFRRVNEGQPLLLTVDEAHMINDHTQLALYKRLLVVPVPQRLSKQVKGWVRTPEHWRDLFYELVVILDVLSALHGWAAYVTGTRFTMTRVSDPATRASLGLRMQPLHFAPSFLLGTDDMVWLLKYYFAFDDAFFGAGDSQVRTALARFRGRPLLFQSGVWSVVVGHVLAKKRLPTASAFAERLHAAYEDMTLRWQERFENYFNCNVPVTSDGSGVRALLPELASAAVSESPTGVFRARSNDGLEAAVLEGFFPVSGNVREFDTRQEPLLLDALARALRRSARSGVFLRTLAHSSRRASDAEKGQRMELVLAWHFALVRWCDGSGVTLGHVLRTMGNCVCDDLLPACVDEWYLNACRAVDAEQKCALSLLFDESTSSVRDDIVLYNIDNMMGADIAFVVSRPHAAATGAPREYKLVTLQCKNAVSSSTLRAALSTLHPGTQFVTNDERAALVADPTSARVVASKKWCAYHDKYTNAAVWPRFLFQGWIRIAAIARLQTRATQKLATETCGAGDERDAAARLLVSPVILLFMQGLGQKGEEEEDGGRDDDDGMRKEDEDAGEEGEDAGADEDEWNEDMEVCDAGAVAALARSFEQVCRAFVGPTRRQHLGQPRGDDAATVLLPVSVAEAVEAMNRAQPTAAGSKRRTAATTAAGSGAPQRKKKR